MEGEEIYIHNFILMIEVFKTNVKRRLHADKLIDRIHKNFIHYKANFDLDDCDRILRIASSDGLIEIQPIVDLMKESGFHAEVLPDEQPLEYRTPNTEYRRNYEC